MFISSDKDDTDPSDTNTNRPKNKGIPDLPTLSTSLTNSKPPVENQETLKPLTQMDF